MKFLELRIPPALLMLLFGGLMRLSDWLLPTFRVEADWTDYAAKALFLLAITVVVSGIVSFRQAKTTVDPTHPERATQVVTGGIYQFSRNPMYLGFALMLLAFAAKMSNPVTILFVPLFVWYLNHFQIKPEELALTQLFGDQYQQYQAIVRRWL